MHGNCIMWDLEFWYRPDVQKYLLLILRTGAAFRFRWQEQGVQAMIWGLFAARDAFEMLPFDVVHRGACS